MLIKAFSTTHSKAIICFAYFVPDVVGFESIDSMSYPTKVFPFRK